MAKEVLEVTPDDVKDVKVPFALKVAQSLEGARIFAGDNILCDAADTEVKAGKVYLFQIGQSVLMRRVTKCDGVYHLEGPNKQLLVKDPREVKAIARVVKVLPREAA